MENLHLTNCDSSMCPLYLPASLLNDTSTFSHESCIRVAIHVKGGVLKIHMLSMTRQCTIYMHAQVPSIPQS